MPLETGTYIDDLDAANPTAGDAVAGGDDHLRLIKAVLKATFPNFSGLLSPSHTVLSGIPARVDTLEGTVIKKDGTVAFTGTQAFGAFPPTCTADPTGTNSLTRRANVDKHRPGGCGCGCGRPGGV